MIDVELLAVSGGKGLITKTCSMVAALEK